MITHNTPGRMYESIEAMLAGATDREVARAPDGKSGSTFWRLRISGARYFVKSLSYDEDWIMRVTDDRDHRPLLVWRAGLYAATPTDLIDHTIVAMAIEGSGTSARLAMLMRDVGEHLIPEGDDVIGVETHLGFIDHMAGFHAHFWGWRDEIGLTPLAHRFRFFAPDNIRAELTRDDPAVVLRVADEGWSILHDRAPQLARVAEEVHARPGRLADALARSPQTFVAGDWKMGNLGRHPDGRTILLDWAYPGEAPGTWDLAWYLALNRARLPISKEETVDAYREGLERRGIDTGTWFTHQLALALLGMAACFAWEKAHGDEDELRWWAEAAARGVRVLTRG